MFSVSLSAGVLSSILFCSKLMVNSKCNIQLNTFNNMHINTDIFNLDAVIIKTQFIQSDFTPRTRVSALLMYVLSTND